MSLITWVVIVWAALILLFLRWNYTVGKLNKEYDKMFEDEAKFKGIIDELDEAVREVMDGKR